MRRSDLLLRPSSISSRSLLKSLLRFASNSSNSDDRQCSCSSRAVDAVARWKAASFAVIPMLVKSMFNSPKFCLSWRKKAIRLIITSYLLDYKLGRHGEWLLTHNRIQECRQYLYCACLLFLLGLGLNNWRYHAQLLYLLLSVIWVTSNSSERIRLF